MLRLKDLSKKELGYKEVTFTAILDGENKREYTVTPLRTGAWLVKGYRYNGIFNPNTGRGFALNRQIINLFNFFVDDNINYLSKETRDNISRALRGSNNVV